MKKTVIAAAVLCLAAGTPIYSFAADPCEVVLCMFGKATGNSGGSECSSAERAFFKINAFKKHHRFNPGKTFNMRKSFLGQCRSADPAAVSKILSKFGRMRG
ncbi:conjugal transfer protein [Salmonella enterica]|uniref:conjugal transfer protein n=1 Tax=Salmonella enterica TaxID=28901 RepID=UPI00129B3832|nr:conjugal transfer protein [Salmonella enterica]EAX8328950.1 conjugal transfer protein [Salmonella enterica]EAZ4079914.1 conjugal transfer protein [Salmonella enterica]EBD4978839.1 conjugal transfer protein [Salmonella enterica]ECZ6618836.1 conjugal transfer protein [Salmonella enterica]EGL2678356.1 conjugal transfer protein [Salmonella enterica]